LVAQGPFCVLRANLHTRIARRSCSVAPIHVDVLDIGIAKVGGERPETEALVVHGLRDRLQFGCRRDWGAVTWLPLGPCPGRVP